MHHPVLGAWLALTLVVHAPCQGAADERLPQHKAAVIASRAGDPAGAWALILEARRLKPGDADVLADYLTLGAWSGHGDEVLAVARPLALATLPVYTLEALGRAARDAKDSAYAVACYREVLQRLPDRQEARQGLVLAALSAGQPKEGSRLLEAMPLFIQKQPEVCAARATLAEAQQDWGGLLAAAEDLLAQKPEDPRALRWRFQALRRLGLADQAKALTPLDLLDLDERAALERDVLMAQQEPLGRFPLAERRRRAVPLIQRYHGCLASLPGGIQADIRLGLVQDLCALYSSLRQYRELVLEAARLAPQGGGPDLHQLLGDAWLNLARPSKALPEFLAVLKIAPGQADATLGCFWALLDQGLWRQARRLTEAGVARLGPKEAAGSRAALDALRLDAQALGYTEALAEAETRLQTLRRQAPADDPTLEALALVWRFRGQPRRALELLSQSARRAPERGWTWLSLAATQRDIHDYPGEAASLAKAADRIPESAGLAQARAESDQARAGHFSLDAENGHARDAAPDAPTGNWDQALQTQVESALIADRWRIQGELLRDQTFLQDHGLDRVRGALAAAYAAPLGQAELAVGSQNRGAIGDPGQGTLRLHGVLTPLDAVWLDFTLARNSGETPLRAWDAGIRGDLAALAATYRWNEGQALRGGCSTLALSDGNHRGSAWTSVEQRLGAWGPHLFSASAGVWLTRDSLAPALAPYFDPVRDRSLDLELTYAGPLWQEGPRGLRQQVQIGGGSYQEQGFATRGTFAASYRLMLNLGGGLEGHLGLRLGERPYDGVVNRRTEVQFGLSGRLP